VDLFSELEKIFNEILIPQAVYDEVCLNGSGLTGDKPLREAVSVGKVK
jgi:rRNA-processing protein FCF1